jgi:flagellar L-ring protein precursor FlgH
MSPFVPSIVRREAAMSTLRHLQKLSLIALVTCTTGGCAYLDRLASVGQEPKLSAVNNPTAERGYRPVTMPMPEPIPASYNPNSLWRNGSRAFFKDQRAHQIGDILTVKVNFTDSATLANETQRGLTSGENAAVSSIFGKTPFASKANPGSLLNTASTSSTDGKGSVNRSEALKTNVAAVVTQLLPNGNLVIEGKQEIRVNFEMRELKLAGIVRPEDIENDNTLDSAKIAQARIAYGGRGQFTDVQQPRWGQQISNVVLPF